MNPSLYFILNQNEFKRSGKKDILWSKTDTLERQIFHHWWINWSNHYWTHWTCTSISYFALKSMSHGKKTGKWRFSVKFCLYLFFLFSEVEILRKPNTVKVCILKNKVLSKTIFERELCSLVCFFIFYANLKFWPAPYQWSKLKFVEIFSYSSLVILAKSGSLVE